MTDTTAETSADQEERELRDAFKVFDKHNRGYITASDLRAVLQCLGEDLDEDESMEIIAFFFFFLNSKSHFFISSRGHDQGSGR
jgi:Ca2+-binding EF-hand superfamily protein